ncbi:hypothetical protein ABI214_12655 [Prescottella soli]|uniref:DNA-binding protein n=1 Tax=Prescottella soli TaxID=1543852 RepID=A0ABW9FZR8_9NOCA
MTDPSAGPALSEHDATLLTEAGFVTDPAAATAARADRDIRMQDLVHSSLSVADAAERLGVTAARIRQRLADGTLWAFDSGQGRLLPGQFTADGAVPHLDKVLPLLDKDLHPLTVQALLTQPQPSLTVDGRPVSIVAWLTGSEGTDAEIEQAADVIVAATWESTEMGAVTLLPQADAGPVFFQVVSAREDDDVFAVAGEVCRDVERRHRRP